MYTHKTYHLHSIDLRNLSNSNIAITVAQPSSSESPYIILTFPPNYLTPLYPAFLSSPLSSPLSSDRIMSIFRNAGRSLRVYTLTDGTLFRALGVGIVLLWIFLIVWMSTQPPEPVKLSDGVYEYTLCQSEQVGWLATSLFCSLLLGLVCSFFNLTNILSTAHVVCVHALLH